MNYEMIGESIKSATSIKLGEIFNNPIRYKENITNQQYPNFHIVQVNSNITQQQRMVESATNTDLRRIQLDYLINIQYRLVRDTETISNLRQQLDNIGFILMTKFTDIQLDKPVEVKNARYEIVDGILQFFFNITVYATMEQVNDVVMNELDIVEELEKEE